MSILRRKRRRLDRPEIPGDGAETLRRVPAAVQGPHDEPRSVSEVLPSAISLGNDHGASYGRGAGRVS